MDFKFEIKNNCIMFKINKSSYKIPSKIYPLNSRKYKIFNYDNTEILKDKRLENIFNLCIFKNGFCYDNSLSIQSYSELYNIEDIKFYSGWIFVGCTYPKHHSWIVYKDKYILDGSLLINIFKIGESIEQNSQNFRQEFARKIRKELDSNKLNSEKFIFGKVIKGLLYVGCEDDYEHSKELYRKTISLLGNKHPSYNKANENPNGLTRIQKMIREIE